MSESASARQGGGGGGGKQFTFSTKLPLQIKPNYFVAGSIEGEEDRVGHDMIKCCSEIENGIGWDAVPIDKNFNGSMQRAQQVLFAELHKDAHVLAQIAEEEEKAKQAAKQGKQFDRNKSFWTATSQLNRHVKKDNAEKTTAGGGAESSSSPTQEGGVEENAFLSSVQNKEQTTWSSLLREPFSFLQQMMAVADFCVDKSRLGPGKKMGNERFRVRQVATSWLYDERGWMFHVWNSARGAKNFVAAWSRLWKTILDYRIEGIYAPMTVLFSMKGSYVSATVLPPVVRKKTPEVHLPQVDGEPPNSFLSYMANQLIHALNLPDQAQLTIYYGTDGRYYLLNTRDLLQHFKIPAFSGGKHWRPELLEGMAKKQEKALPPSHEDAMTFLQEVCIPGAIKRMIEFVSMVKVVQQRTIPNLFEAGVVRRAMHENGVNFCFSHDMLKALESAVSGEHYTWASNNKDILKLCVSVLKVEMVSRVVKQFARHDMQQQIMAGLTDDNQILDAFNRVAKLATSANAPTFFREHLLPAMRKKFKTPDDFVITPKEAGAMLGLRTVANKLGILYDPQQQKFVKFTSSPMPFFAYVSLKSPAPRPDKVPPAEMKAMVDEAWKVVDSVRAQPHHSYTIRKNLWTARAMVQSVLHGDHRGRLDEVWRECLQEEGRGDGKSKNQDCEATWVEFERARIAGIHCEHAVSKVQKDPSAVEELLEHHGHLIRELAQVPVDQPIAVVMILRLAIARWFGGLEPQPNLFREAILELPSNASWVSFFRNDVFIEALKDMELQIPKMAKETVTTLHEVVADVRTQFEKSSQSSLPIKYETRVLRSILPAPVAERHIDSHRLAVKLHSDTNTKYGPRDGRTVLNVYCSTLMALQTVEELELHDQVYDLFNSVIKITGDSLGDAVSRGAFDIIKDWRTIDILNRGYLRMQTHRAKELEEAGASWEGDSKAPETFLITAMKILREHLDALGDWYLATLLMQRVGRGFRARRDFHRAYVAWLQERKDIRAMEEARRLRLAHMRAQVKKRLQEFFFARKIEKSDQEIDLMVIEAFEAESVDAYFDYLRTIYGDIALRQHTDLVATDDNSGEALAITPRAQIELEADYDFAAQAKLAEQVPTQEELFQECMQDMLYKKQLEQLFDTVDIDHDLRASLKESYEVLLPLKIMSPKILHRMFLCGTEQDLQKPLEFEAWARHVVNTEAWPPLEEFDEGIDYSDY